MGTRIREDKGGWNDVGFNGVEAVYYRNGVMGGPFLPLKQRGRVMTRPLDF